jgi:hypothetical protein
MRRVGTWRRRVRGRRAQAAPAVLEGAAAADPAVQAEPVLAAELGCGRRRTTAAGHDRPRMATAGAGQDWPRPATARQRLATSAAGHGLASLLVDVAMLASPWWWGQGVGWCLLVASRWCFGRRRASSSGGDAEVTGAGFGSAAGRVLMRAKAFSDVIVGGHDGGTLGASLSLLGASWRGTMPSATRGSQGEDPVHLRTCGSGALASYPP